MEKVFFGFDALYTDEGQGILILALLYAKITVKDVRTVRLLLTLTTMHGAKNAQRAGRMNDHEKNGNDHQVQ